MAATPPQRSSSLVPPVVPMELHAINRNKLLESLRQNLAQSGRPIHGIVLLQGGEEQNRYCTDHVELFRQESYFAYLFGVREPGFFAALAIMVLQDITTGLSLLFAPRLTADYAIWQGEIKPPSYFKERYMVHAAFYVDEMVNILRDKYQGPGRPLLFLLHGLNTDSNNFSKPAEFKGIEDFEKELDTLHPILTECRVCKTEMELALIQFANDISSEAHIAVGL
ncbi:Xaa-Pro dipeptidase-like protein [Drosera capensis]